MNSNEDQAVIAAKLRQLAEDTDPLFVQDLGSEFLNSAPHLLAEIDGALASGDQKRAAMLAHSLKANAATFGLAELARQLFELETACKSEEGRKPVEICGTARQAYPESAKKLEAQLREMPPAG